MNPRSGAGSGWRGITPRIMQSGRRNPSLALVDRAAIARWCGRRFGVGLDPETEIVPTYGSKEAIFLLAQVVVDSESDKRLVVATDPGYPVPERGAAFAGAEVLHLPLLEENGFL